MLRFIYENRSAANAHTGTAQEKIRRESEGIGEVLDSCADYPFRKQCERCDE